MPRAINADVNKTSIIEVRCDVRKVATILKYFDSIEYPVFSKSDLLTQIVEFAYNTLVDCDAVKAYEDIETAADAMAVRFRQTGRDRRAMRHIAAVTNINEMNVCGSGINAMNQEVKVDMKALEDKALEYLKVHDPELYKVNKERIEKERAYVSGDNKDGSVKLSPESSIIPDLMGSVPTNIVKQDN